MGNLGCPLPIEFPILPLGRTRVMPRALARNPLPPVNTTPSRPWSERDITIHSSSEVQTK